jgi:hypothetical protein
MQPPLDALASVQPPPGWQRVERPNGTAFADESALDSYDGDVTSVPLMLFVSVLDPAGHSVQRVAEDLMSRRVRQGYPGRFDAVISGLPALGFDWTDGIMEILSYFVLHARGWILEFQVARACHPVMYMPGFDRSPLRSIAEDLLAGVRWNTGPTEAV